MRASPRRPVDLVAGLLLVALAVLVWHLNARFALGALRSMGPGYMPRILAVLLGALGLGIAVGAWFGGRVPRAAWRPRAALLLAAAMLAFGLLIERAGLVVAAFATVPLAALAGDDARPVETLAFAAVAAAFAVVVFVWGLGQVMPVLPWSS